MATTVFSSDLNVSCSIVYPVINGLLSNHLVVSQDDVSAVKTFKRVVAEALRQRFMPSSDTIPILCAAVDPRYSDLVFLDEEQRVAVHEELILQMEDSLSKEPEEPPTKKSKDSALHFLLGSSSKQQAIATSRDELQHFNNITLAPHYTIGERFLFKNTSMLTFSGFRLDLSLVTIPPEVEKNSFCWHGRKGHT